METRVPRRALPIALAAILLLVSACSQAASKTVGTSLGAKAIPTIKPPAYVPGPLDGEPTAHNLAMRRPLAVIIENYDPDSRPQVGLGAASTVIETLAEGGVTRFMAIYLEHDADKVGPVRSTRMYFDDWAGAFHAILSHVGGNDDAQAFLWHLPSVFNVDENRWEVSLTNTGTPLFFRTTDRQAPHNLYTNTYKLRAYADSNGQDWPYSEAYLPHKQPLPPKQRGTSGNLWISFINPLFPQANPGYAVRYQYDRSTNTYRRFMGGAPHVDPSVGGQLRPSNVVVMLTGDAAPDPNAGITPQSILIPVLGKGQAVFFRDGKVERGSWSQPNQFAPLRFYGARGRLAEFNPGQTWIEVVPASSKATWSFR